jgi:5'-3' exonuclease
VAGAAFAARKNAAVDRVFICTPDKDLSQCVRGTRVLQLDRRKNIIRDEAGMIAKFGVEPVSIPDCLALVGDTADGYPGLAGWGAKSASKVLARYRHIKSIPENWRHWGVDVVNPLTLSETLRRLFERALLFRNLATLSTEIPLFQSVEELRWAGASAAFPPLAARLDASITKKKAARS